MFSSLLSSFLYHTRLITQPVRVFRTEGKFPERPGFETLKAYREKRVEHFTSAGILADNGESWWNIRSKAQQPFLKTKSINNYIPILGQIAQEFIDRLILFPMARL